MTKNSQKQAKRIGLLCIMVTTALLPIGGAGESQGERAQFVDLEGNIITEENVPDGWELIHHELDPSQSAAGDPYLPVAWSWRTLFGTPQVTSEFPVTVWLLVSSDGSDFHFYFDNPFWAGEYVFGYCDHSDLFNIQLFTGHTTSGRGEAGLFWFTDAARATDNYLVSPGDCKPGYPAFPALTNHNWGGIIDSDETWTCFGGLGPEDCVGWVDARNRGILSWNL